MQKGRETKLNPHIVADKAWYLSLLDEGEQTAYEEEHLKEVLLALRRFYVARFQHRIKALKGEMAEIGSRKDYGGEDYRQLIEKKAEVTRLTKKLNSYRCFFSEPYFARIDVTDPKDGYNSYYIGKRGDVNLEIVDWRAPLAVRYYQKSRVSFTINDYEYRTVLRRALSVRNGKFISYKNEYLSVKDILTPEEIAGRDEELLFDPYLRSIIKERKDDSQVRDIIQTIQEQQFDIVTRPERESFVLQGCAGSGKTMILLHRLSYLMYNNEKLRPRDVLVITPSDSFNAFIDELTEVLELQRVKTVTLRDYFFQLLAAEGILIPDRLEEEKENEEYLAYLYSPRFTDDAKRRLRKLYGELYGMFASDECREVALSLLSDCKSRQEKYVVIKNASVRIRRCVLGELKDRGDGGFYFTKPFRTLMSAFTEVEDFFSFVLKEEERTPDYFFRQYTEFYRCAHLIATAGEKIFAGAVDDLKALYETVEREIADLRRYRRKVGGEEIYTYAERMERREELKREIGRISDFVRSMKDGLALFQEFFSVVLLTGHGRELGKCKDRVDVARWLYRETVQKSKRKYGMKGLYPSDGYAIAAVLSLSGRKLTPRYGLVFIDEGQDISEGEYELLKRINSDAAFNVFGDLKQNITPYRGIPDWSVLGAKQYFLNRNYRNTNEIVEYVSGFLDARMLPIGLGGEEVRTLTLRQVNQFFRGACGLKAVIAKEEYLPLFEKRGYKRLGTGALSKSKINVMSVYESKGLEFSAVAVYSKGMSDNERYVACTRALKTLAIIGDTP